MNVFVEHERLMIEIRSSISCCKQQDKETKAFNAARRKRTGMT